MQPLLWIFKSYNKVIWHLSNNYKLLCLDSLENNIGICTR